jgi:hypothetical protein
MTSTHVSVLARELDNGRNATTDSAPFEFWQARRCIAHIQERLRAAALATLMATLLPHPRTVWYGDKSSKY